MIPMQPHFLAMQGMAKLLETVQLVGVDRARDSLAAHDVWPDIANRNRIQAPRAPGWISAASWSSIRPP